MSKQKRTFFSIVIPTYNMEKFIKKSVKSVLNQTYKNFEILVIDNHSKDKTRQIIDDLPFAYKRVRTNQGWRLISVYIKEKKPSPPPPPPPRTPRPRARRNLMNECCIIF